MSTDNDNASDVPRPIETAEVEQIFTSMWETTARINPMLLTRLSPHAFERLRQMIRDCLAKGMTATATREHIVKELLRSGISSTRPRKTSDGPGARRGKPSAS
jgi:hypothetical protein